LRDDAAVDRKQILAFRLASHNLTRRLEARSLTKVAGASGIQETPTSSAPIALLARVTDLTENTLSQALGSDRSLITLWAMRGAPYVVPAGDLWTFSIGALPRDAKSFRTSLGGWSDALVAASLDPFETLRRMRSAAEELLYGRTMNVNELRDRIYARVRSLSRIERPTFARADMPEPLFRALGTTGAVCIVAGRGTNSEVALTDQWLTSLPTDSDTAHARAELARRFLHCFGPATAKHFADWTQRSLADSKEAFRLIESEVEEITIGRAKAMVLVRDRKALASPPEPAGVRLLPVGDPYLQQRDRATVVMNEGHRRKLWQPTRGPGGVLVDGEVIGVWRARTSGKRLVIAVEPFERLSRSMRKAVEDEAERIAPIRSCASVDVGFPT
jgi:Winged helix DNA-binding domain